MLRINPSSGLEINVWKAVLVLNVAKHVLYQEVKSMWIWRGFLKTIYVIGFALIFTKAQKLCVIIVMPVS